MKMRHRLPPGYTVRHTFDILRCRTYVVIDSEDHRVESIERDGDDYSLEDLVVTEDRVVRKAWKNFLKRGY